MQDQARDCSGQAIMNLKKTSNLMINDGKELENKILMVIDGRISAHCERYALKLKKSVTLAVQRIQNIVDMPIQDIQSGLFHDQLDLSRDQVVQQLRKANQKLQIERKKNLQLEQLLLEKESQEGNIQQELKKKELKAQKHVAIQRQHIQSTFTRLSKAKATFDDAFNNIQEQHQRFLGTGDKEYYSQYDIQYHQLRFQQIKMQKQKVQMDLQSCKDLFWMKSQQYLLQEQQHQIQMANQRKTFENKLIQEIDRNITLENTIKILTNESSEKPAQRKIEGHQYLKRRNKSQDALISPIISRQQLVHKLGIINKKVQCGVKSLQSQS